jgi:TolB-like protein/Flp pilus assembly protein TadD
MPDTRRPQVKDVFHAALELDPGARAAFLDQTCRNDPALRREVEALLASHSAGGRFLTNGGAPPDVVEDAGASSGDGVPTPAQAGSGTSKPPALRSGALLGPYEIIELLGAGGMGEVYRARDTRLGREVAVKVLPEHLQANAAARGRFEREARAVAALSHPNILALHDVGEHGGIAFAVTELLQGETLRQRLSRAPLSWRTAVDMAAAIADGLAAAHAKGIVHRDLKPENVFLTQDGRVKVLDFGLARLERPLSSPDSNTPTASQMTRPGMVMGTIGYMAPEQLRGEPVTPAADIFSLGCVLSEMLCGRAPFARSTPAECIAAVLSEEPAPPPSLSSKDVPAALVPLLRRCLAKDPHQRLQSARDVALGLRDLLQGTSGRGTDGRRVAAGAAAGMAVLALVVAAATDVGGWRSRLRPSATRRITSLAVLPMENLSRDPAQDYFADGLTNALIADLATLSDLRVISRASVMRYKGNQEKKTVPEIAREMGVEAVVTGAVQRAGDQISVSAQLIDGASDRQLWAHRYERSAADILALERELARAIAGGVQARLTPDQQARLSQARPVDPQIYEMFVKGSHQCSRGATLVQGAELLEAAIARDPTYAPAYADLANCYHFVAFFLGAAPASETYARAKAAAQQALKLDPRMGAAHNALAQVRLHYEWDFPGAEREFRTALELAPGDGSIHHWYAHYLLAMGRVEESVAETRRALESNPLNAGVAACVGWHCFFARQYDEAIEATREALAIDPKSHMGHYYLAWAYEKKADFESGIAELQKANAILLRPAGLASLVRMYARAGKRTEALKTQAELQAMARKRHVPAYDMAVALAGLGERDRAFEWLDKAYEQRDAMMVHVNWDPRFEELRSDPRFPALVRRMGLPT